MKRKKNKNKKIPCFFFLSKRRKKIKTEEELYAKSIKAGIER